MTINQIYLFQGWYSYYQFHHHFVVPTTAVWETNWWCDRRSSERGVSWASQDGRRGSEWKKTDFTCWLFTWVHALFISRLFELKYWTHIYILFFVLSYAIWKQYKSISRGIVWLFGSSTFNNHVMQALALHAMHLVFGSWWAPGWRRHRRNFIGGQFWNIKITDTDTVTVIFLGTTGLAWTCYIWQFWHIYTSQTSQVCLFPTMSIWQNSQQNL